MPTAKPTKIQSCVIDASVAVKWFSQEQGTATAEVFLSRAFEGTVELYAPDLLIYEVANALWKGKKLVSEKISAALETVYDSPLQLFPPDKLLVSSATRFMVDYDISFYDAAYAALAHILQKPLLSADPKSHAKIKEIELIKL